MADRFENLVDLWQRCTEKYAARPYLGSKTQTGWTWTSYAEFRKLVDAFRSGLAALGVKHGDRVALISDNRLEWAVGAYSILGLGAVIVPIYEAQSPDEWAFILRDSGAKVALAATRRVVDELTRIKSEIPEVSAIVGFDLEASDERSYARVLELGRAAPAPVAAIEPKDSAGFLYTSGTTGQPKGVVLSHGNIISNVNVLGALFPITCEDRSLAFLPWAHALGQTGELHMLTSLGCSIAINDQVPNLLGNLKEIAPTILISVPRIFNRIYDGVNKQMAERPAPIRALFRNGIAAATRRSRGEKLGVLEELGLFLADKLVFSKVRARVGGRLQYAVSGSAALSKEVAEFVDALGIQVYEGYGLTETSPVATVNYPNHRKIGSVGKALPDVRIAIDTQVTGDAENGEILVYGPCVMQGYHHRPEETQSVLMPDGGLRTGDMGRLDAEGYLYITGRIKEQYKLENGKYVVPSPLEELLKLSPYIANVMLYGVNRPHNVALVVLDVDAVQRWAKSQGRELGDATQDPGVRALVRAELARLSQGFKSFERPADFALITEDFTVENGMLTPSLKVKRRSVLEKYAPLIESTYRAR